MQAEFDSESPELNIQIIGVNDVFHASGNPNVTNGRDIPWLQDVDLNNNSLSDATRDLWDTTQRDVVIVDTNGEQVEVYNLTSNDLANGANYNTLKQKILDASASESDPAPWQNAANPMDVNDDGFVSPIDALQVINYLNNNGAGELPSEKTGGSYIDPSGDNFIAPRDALLVINHLNSSDNGAVASRPASAAIDAAFASRLDLDEFDLDDDKDKKATERI